MTAIEKCLDAPTRAVDIQLQPFRRFNMKKQQLLTIALGSAFAAVTLMPAHAAGNPFAAKTLDAGYQVAQADTKAKDGKCGEAKCGADKKAKEGSCGGDKKKDASCGAKKS
jgi:uncharacterized low-complexity protein